MMVKRNNFMSKALDSIIKERERQEAKWGEQNHNQTNWLAILAEEFGEYAKEVTEQIFGADNWDKIREECVQTAAVALAIVECIDRNGHGQ